jgi:putative phage-type endonuclease
MDIITEREMCLQGTDEWHNIRKGMITATDVSAILDSNPFMNIYQLYDKKMYNQNKIDNENTRHGIFFEQIAIDIYKQQTRYVVHPVGLIQHATIPFLGASPDGIVNNGERLIEIKCPRKRKITENVPDYYWIQVQIQLEVCNIELCDYVECEFSIYESDDDYNNDTSDSIKGYTDDKYWKLEKISIKQIKRYREWFKTSFPKIKEFWYSIQPAPNNKRRQIINGTIVQQKRRKYNSISVGDITNYLLNDTLIDWLDMYGIDNDYEKDIIQKYDFNNYLKTRGNEFATFITSQLKDLYPENYIDINEFTNNRFNQTIDNIRKRVPIIFNPLMHNNNIYGCPNIIMRGDYVDELFSNISVRINKRFYYVVDICFSSYQDANNKIHGNNINIDVSKMLLYNDLLSSIQEYKPSVCFIVCKKLKQHGRIYKSINYPVNIHINKYKIMYKNIYDAINWLHNLKLNGHTWCIDPPNKIELYPNMNNTNNNGWTSVKKKIAIKNHTISLLWQCGIKTQRLLLDSGISKWTQCDGKLLNVGNSRINILNDIISINKSKTHNILPVKLNTAVIKRNFNNLELYIDFETINDLNEDFHSDSEFNGMIYLIGCGYALNGKWVFKYFLANKLNYSSEKKIVELWLKYIDELKNNYNDVVLYHWTHAEVSHFENAISRHNIVYKLNWYDLYKYFISVPIVIKNVFKYDLKSIATELYKLKKINTHWDNDVSALSSMLIAWEASELSKHIDMNAVIQYNEVDCKVLFEILLFLRK